MLHDLKLPLLLGLRVAQGADTLINHVGACAVRQFFPFLSARDAVVPSTLPPLPAP